MGSTSSKSLGLTRVPTLELKARVEDLYVQLGPWLAEHVITIIPPECNYVVGTIGRRSAVDRVTSPRENKDTLCHHLALCSLSPDCWVALTKDQMGKLSGLESRVRAMADDPTAGLAITPTNVHGHIQGPAMVR